MKNWKKKFAAKLEELEEIGDELHEIATDADGDYYDPAVEDHMAYLRDVLDFLKGRIR